MSPIKVLVVADGVTDLLDSEARHGITFAARVTDPNASDPGADDQFTLSVFLDALQKSQTYSPTSPPISVDTAHRRNITSAAFPNFNFATTIADLTVYDEIWLFGYEGLNDDLTPYLNFSAISPAEVTAIENFMNSGGGVFATGDHSGLGSYMCGLIPRVRSMRKWFYSGSMPAGYPAAWANWPGGTADRADTIVEAPDGWHFDNQSDDKPQTLTVIMPHPILQGANGQIVLFPDHMHEGEVITPWSVPGVTPASVQAFIDEYPYQEQPKIIATGQVTGGHESLVDQGMMCENTNFGADTTQTTAKVINTLCVYDGHNAGIGRIVTDSSFHHYIDLNLIGDPCSSVPAKQHGFSTPASAAILADLRTFYINTAIWIARIPKSVTFLVERSTFGQDEIAARRKQPRNTPGGLPIQDAFRIVIDGFNAAALGLTSTSSTLAAPPVFNPGVSGITIIASSIAPNTPNSSDNGDYGPELQRFTLYYDIDFPDATDPEFNFAAATKLVDLNVTVGGIAAAAQIELIKQPDPFILHGDPPWLSIDLRVFTVRSGEISSFGPTMGSDASGAPTFIQQVMDALNPANSTVRGVFDNLPTDESSKLFVYPQDNNGNNVFNFALAKVHYIGLIGAMNVRVFFRLFQAQTTTGAFDYPPGAEYRRATNSQGQPIPLAGIQGSEYVTIPCFANARIDSTANNMSQQTDGFNILPFTAHADGSEVDQYFGCWLDINQPTKVNGSANNVLPITVPPSNTDGPFTDPLYPPLPIQQAVLKNLHQCLVAEIAFDPVAIPIGKDPSNWDKLAQRNLAWSDVGSAQAVSTFEIRPTPATLLAQQSPDELMIDWGNLPHGSTAQIYLPAVDIAEVLAMAARTSASHRLTQIDAHTLQSKTGGVSYIPIPPGGGINYAGLLSIELPAALRRGQTFNVVVRQITNAVGLQTPPPPPPPPPPRVAARRHAVAAVAASRQIEWRRVLGAFQLRIPVGAKDVLLVTEERQLAVLRWIAEAIPPHNRWYLVFRRYLEQIAGRVRVFGGDPIHIQPSPTGTVGSTPPHPHPHPDPRHEKLLAFTGKVAGLVFDRFGDFEGFLLDTKDGERTFRSREREIKELAERAWRERLRITVTVEHGQPHRPVSIIVRQPPVPF
jgi:hypothetical protein